MCWFGYKRKRIAQSDIPVFKLVCGDENGFQSLYKHFPYELNKEYSESFGFLKAHVPRYTMIGKGFHSYDQSLVLKRVHHTLYIENERGYRLSFLKLCPLHNLVKLNCIIPKGTIYYENAFKVIVSERIIPIDFISIKTLTGL